MNTTTPGPTRPTNGAEKFDYELMQEVAGALRQLSADSGLARRRLGNEEDLDALPNNMDPWLVDFCKIANTTGGRRLAFKTQVFTGSKHAHVRNRSAHTSEVVAHSSMIAGCLGLNVPLTMAIAQGHDIGHAPFGHEGEEFVNMKLRQRDSGSASWKHGEMSSIILDLIERNGAGMNLTHQVLKGIPQHTSGGKLLRILPDMSQEAAVVMCGDKIAYTTGDFSDMRRLGVSIPKPLMDEMLQLGAHRRERVRRLIRALCVESAEKGYISFCESEDAQRFAHIRQMMKKMYPLLNIQDAEVILEKVYRLLSKFMDLEEEKLFKIDPLLVLCLMTDNDALMLAENPTANIQNVQQTSVWELLPGLNGKKIDFLKLNLNWKGI